MVYSFAEDRQGNLFACIGDHIVRFENERFVPFPGPDRGTDQSALSCRTDADGTLWVHSAHYLGSYREGKWVSVPWESTRTIAGVTASRDGGMWVAETNCIR